MRWEQFLDSSGIRVHYRVWDSAPPTKAVVAILHGIGEHSGRYDETARALAAAGYEVWADDHHGHGETGREMHGDLSRIGRPGPGGMRATIAAISEFLDLAKAAHPELPFIVLGHSWGSLVAQILLNRSPGRFDGVILSGTAYRTPLHMDSGNLNRKHKALGTTGAEWLSRDPAVAAAFVADPLCTTTPLMKLYGVRDTLSLLGRPARHLPNVPLLIAVGGDDTLGGERSARALANSYLQRSGLRDLTVFVYPGARHEILNETNRTEVFADLVGWLDERFAANKS